MADSNSDSSNAPNLVNAILALLTLIGGFYFISQKLSSDRPLMAGGESPDFIGRQEVEARLWQDPFSAAKSAPSKEEKANVNIVITDCCGVVVSNRVSETGQGTNVPYASLKAQIQHATNNSTVILMPVMVSGGHYSEDQESRIRSRYAVISALGVSGFVPDDAEHIGTAKIPWPNEDELGSAIKTNLTNDPNICFSNLLKWGKDSKKLDLRYEWFLQREFFPGSMPACGAHPGSTNILVLWLNDSYFEDHPLIRLPLLLYALVETNDANNVKLVGPERSTTLRAMLPWGVDGALMMDTNHTNFVAGITNWLKKIDMYSATASAIDEVLVTNGAFTTNPCYVPREAVRNALTNLGFASFHNFAATDAQMAQQIFDELELRDKTSLKNTKNHLVLISEWDTFYARMVGLTYMAKLATWEDWTNSPWGFIQYYRSTSQPWTPPNFHSYVYLRGLDGQTVSNEFTSTGGKGETADAKAQPASFDELRKWTPDANKAEGPAQFDYVSRLGDQLQELEEQLDRCGNEHIRAIGVMGSDVYDTLLILQALRPKFPNAIFFTTDMDARFCHPKELAWSRNLIVASGFGLSLDERLQKNIAPFRESLQTAQFAAALAAMGNADLLALPQIPPRLFEIGRHGALDLSPDPLPAHEDDDCDSHKAKGFRLHPLTLAEYLHKHPLPRERLYSGLAAALLFFYCLFKCVPSLNRWAWGWPELLLSALQYAQEDLGGPDEALGLAWQILNPPPVLLGAITARGLLRPFNALQLTLAAQPDILSLIRRIGLYIVMFPWLSKRDKQELQEMKTELAETLVKVFNEFIVIPPGTNVKFFKIREATFWENRQKQDKLLHLLSCNTTGFKSDALKAAWAARDAAKTLFWSHWRQLRFFWIFSSAVLAVSSWMGFCIWQNTHNNPEGQPFSFGDGTSAWPAQIIRLLVIAVSVFFTFFVFYKKCTVCARITRSFRLTKNPPSVWDAGKVPAEKIWAEYLRTSWPRPISHGWLPAFMNRFLYRWGPRLKYVVLPAVLYFVFIVLVSGTQGFQLPFSPVRGDASKAWNRILIPAIFSFLILTFSTIRAVVRCRRFILALTKGPTHYSSATLAHFALQNGQVDEKYLDEWIDVKLIGDLTAQIGTLAYWPFVVFLLLLIARNEWSGNWPWPGLLIFTFILNLVMAAIGMVILRSAASKAKQLAQAALSAKIKQLEVQLAPRKAKADKANAEALLEEILNDKRGAFAKFWNSPVFGAMLLPSGGLTLFQLLIWILGR